MEAERQLEGKDSLLDEDADSTVAQDISSFDDTKLKEAFQESRSSSDVRGRCHVAATLMIELLEEVKLVVVKNEEFNDAHRKFGNLELRERV
jgi:hypothetical protein